MIAMRRILRVVLWSMAAILVLGAALFGYFVYTPAPEKPALSGKLTAGSITVGGYKRVYLLYVPRGLAKGAPLVLALHGSGEDGTQMRIQTGYGFDREADAHGFAVAYPDGYEGYWNACNIAGDYAANTLNIDDVGFLSALAEKLSHEIGSDPARVFAAGVSRGGQMAFRLALEAPARFRAVAAVSANLPAPGNFKCKAVAHGTPSVMIMNGTADPLSPYEGGEVRLFGLFMARGRVLSSRESGQYFADYNHIVEKPQTHETPAADGMRVEDVRWRGGGSAEVELVGIHGGGHGMPQPWRRLPHLLGPTPREPNGPATIWAFFARQR
jgi:polyhydroxybutyrate depolymerase